MAYNPMSINALPETIVVRDEKGNIRANNIGEGSHGGAADTAKKLETPFNLSISGFVSADAVSVDGSKDVTLVTKDITDLNVSSLAVSGETQLANVNISGNLSVAGTTTTVDSENITVKDNIITLNEGETGEGVTKGTAGIEVNRGTLPTYKILFDENDDMFKVGTDEQMEIIASQPYVTEEVNKKAAEIEEKIPDTTNMVTYSEFEYNGTKRKTIQLANYDSISGVTTSGEGANLIMVSKWDKVDVGTSNLECNLNAKDGIVTINDDKTIATVDQIPSTENFATKEELSAKADSVHTHKIADITDLNLDTYATKEELANYATTAAVTEEINNKATEIEEKIPDTTNMVTYSEFEYGGAKRKTIQLANYDSISGVTTGGEGANLIMVSKWDKVDVGTSNLECNLNAKNGVVTINDSKTIATVDQIPSTENFATKEELSAKADITYVDQKVADLVNGAPEALDTLNELAVALNENKDGVTALLEEVGQIDAKVDAITVDSLGAAHAEHKHVIADITDFDDSKYATVESLSAKADSVHTHKVADITDLNLDTYATKDELANYATTEVVNEADSALTQKVTDIESKMVSYQLYPAEEYPEDPGRKAIQLNNYDNLIGLTKDGDGVSLAMISKWDVADFGSTKVHMNLNTKDAVTMNDSKVMVITDIDAEHPEQTVYDLKTAINNATSELASKKELPHIINIPIRSLSDKIYEKTEIFEWFGVETDEELKKYISGDIPLFVKYGISYSTLPHYYKFPVEYIAYESDNQVKLVFTGLNTKDDSAVKYEIICNLDGSVVAETSSNVSLVLTPIDKEVDLSGYDTSEEVDEKVSSLGVVNLGNFNTSGEAENKAKEDGVYNDVSKKVLVYTVNNTDSGYIINDVYGTGTTQYLYLKGKRYSRNIVSGEATPFVEIYNYAALPKKAINGLDFFKLTTDSSADDIKAAMSAGGELITESDLDSCLAYGFAIREYTMQSNTIFVGFNGTGFTFTYIGYPNPKKDLVVKSITVKVDGDTYEVLVNGTSGTILTSSNLEADTVFAGVKSELEATTAKATETASTVEQLQSTITSLEEQISQLTARIEALEGAGA